VRTATSLGVPTRPSGGAAEIDDRRGHRSDGQLPLRVFSEAVVGSVRAHNDVGSTSVGPTSVSFDMRHGTLAETTVFWASAVQDLAFAVEQSNGVGKILAG
jgi:hypothetical protein